MLALLGLAVPVAAYLAARRLQGVTIVQATCATCGSAVLGGAAVLLARRGLRNAERTLGRVGCEGTARVGRLLGVIPAVGRRPGGQGHEHQHRCRYANFHGSNNTFQDSAPAIAACPPVPPSCIGTPSGPMTRPVTGS